MVGVMLPPPAWRESSVISLAIVSVCFTARSSLIDLDGQILQYLVT